MQVKAKSGGLFGDDDDDMFGGAAKTVAAKQAATKTVAPDTSVAAKAVAPAKAVAAKAVAKKASLFGDDDEVCLLPGNAGCLPFGNLR